MPAVSRPAPTPSYQFNRSHETIGSLGAEGKKDLLALHI
jgi:hypothetical protein